MTADLTADELARLQQAEDDVAYTQLVSYLSCTRVAELGGLDKYTESSDKLDRAEMAWEKARHENRAALSRRADVRSEIWQRQRAEGTPPV